MRTDQQSSLLTGAFAEGAPMSADLVSTRGDLTVIVERLRGAPRYALDTEFHRERTYWPRVALVQLAWSGPAGATEVALVDPQAVDLRPLAEILDGPGTMVAHAADQDLEVLRLACGTGPSRLLDTQIAAGFAGHGSASLAALSSRYLGIEVAKGDRLTDWSVRPLTASQLRYAAADVDHLLDLAAAIEADLGRLGRIEWAEEESEILRARPHGPPDPKRAWWRLRDARQLRGQARGVACAVAAWREERAQDQDVPVRHVLPDLAVQAIAHRPPTSARALAAVRGLDQRFLRAGADDAILAAVERGRAMPDAEIEAPAADEVPRELRPAVALAMAWVGQVAKQSAVDASLLGTRSDVVGLLRPGGGSRLRFGWRWELAGSSIGPLVDGNAALAFDGDGGLLIEARSHQPLPGTPPTGAPTTDDQAAALDDPAVASADQRGG